MDTSSIQNHPSKLPINASALAPNQGPANVIANQLLTEQQAAPMLGVSIRTLQAWRIRGGGPQFVKLSGKCVRYRAGDLEKFIEARIHDSTSSY